MLSRSDDQVWLTCDKQKDFERFPPIGLKVVAPYEGSDTLIVRLAEDVVPSGTLTETQIKLLQVMRDSFGQGSCMTTEWLKACGISVQERSYYRARKVLIDLGFVRQQGNQFILTDRGHCHGLTEGLTGGRQ